ncbi:MAG: tetratricopeptide repeat protein [Phycisphaerales bacterium]
MAWKTRSLEGECTRRGTGVLRAMRPGFLKLAALFALVLVAGVIGATVYLLRDPAAPLPWAAPLRALPNAAASAGPAQTPRRVSATDSRKVDEILDSVDKLLRQGKAAEAEAVVRGALEQFAADQRLHVAMAELLLGKDELAGAYESYLRALAAGDRDAKLEFQAGTVASMLGKNDRAIEHYGAAQTADPSNAEYPLYLGQVQLQLNKLNEARANLVRAGSLNPEDARVWGSLAEIALRENKLDAAAQQIEKARKLQPRVTLWRAIDARINLRAGKPEQAVELLVALEPAEKTQEFYARVLADALSAARRDADAAEILANASDAAPKNANLAFDAAVRAKRAGKTEAFDRLRERAKQLRHPDADTLGASAP